MQINLCELQASLVYKVSLSSRTVRATHRETLFQKTIKKKKRTDKGQKKGVHAEAIVPNSAHTGTGPPGCSQLREAPDLCSTCPEVN